MCVPRYWLPREDTRSCPRVGQSQFQPAPRQSHPSPKLNSAVMLQCLCDNLLKKGWKCCAATGSERNENISLFILACLIGNKLDQFHNLSCSLRYLLSDLPTLISTHKCLVVFYPPVLLRRRGVIQELVGHLAVTYATNSHKEKFLRSSLASHLSFPSPKVQQQFWREK